MSSKWETFSKQNNMEHRCRTYCQVFSLWWQSWHSRFSILNATSLENVEDARTRKAKHLAVNFIKTKNRVSYNSQQGAGSKFLSGIQSGEAHKNRFRIVNSWNCVRWMHLKQFVPKKQLTPCSGVLLEKLTVTQLVKKFPAVYETLRFITVFTRARPRPRVTFRNKLDFYGEDSLAPRQTPKTDRPLSAVCDSIMQNCTSRWRNE
jgi:hypothetical protein